MAMASASMALSASYAATAALSPPSSSPSSSSLLSSHGLRACPSPRLRIISAPALPPRPRKCTPPSAMAVSLPVLTFDGSTGGEVDLDLKCARPETARSIVHRGVVTELQNRRRGTASTLTRAEVRGGGRKPYKQKKTGKARRGSQRTPLRPGGGVIFGPKPKDWSIKINRKEKRLAISTALQRAAESMIVVEDFEESIEPKTKVFISALKRWGADPAQPSLLFTTNATENLVKSSRNLSTLKLLTPRSLNLYDVVRVQKLIITKSGIEYLNGQYSAQQQESESFDDDDDEEEEGEQEEGTNVEADRSSGGREST